MVVTQQLRAQIPHLLVTIPQLLLLPIAQGQEFYKLKQKKSLLFHLCKMRGNQNI